MAITTSSYNFGALQSLSLVKFVRKILILLASRVESEYFWNDPNLVFLGFGAEPIANSNEALVVEAVDGQRHRRISFLTSCRVGIVFKQEFKKVPDRQGLL